MLKIKTGERQLMSWYNQKQQKMSGDMRIKGKIVQTFGEVTS